MAKITIPCHWNREIIDRIVAIPQENDLAVSEVYGALPKGGPVGHGRAAESVVQVNAEEALSFRKYLASVGLKLTYLLNAPFDIKNEPENKRQLQDYLGWILGELKPEAVTITSHALMQEVRKLDPEIDIHVSTIAGVKNAKDLEQYLDVHPNRVVPHHDVGKDWESLKGLTAKAKENGVEIEMMATESCLLHCPNREAHYKHLGSQRSQDAPFHTTCNTRKLLKPRELLLAGGIIRPEDVHLYEEMGVDYIKITGRSKPAGWLPEVVEAYTARKYEGNLVRLLGIDPSLKAEDWIKLDNASLDGFLKGFPQGEGYRSQSVYCEEWITGLYAQGNYQLTDGSSYSIEGNSLRLNMPYGDKAGSIISRESEK